MMQIKHVAEPFTLKVNTIISVPVSRLMSAKNNGYCRVANTRWGELGFPKFCQSVLTWEVKNLDIQQNEDPSILKHISSIKFSHLMILNVASNNIQSIEALSLINLKNLEELNLSNNKITDLKDIRRLHTFRLRRLKICNNPFTQIQDLSQMPLMNLEVLILQNENKGRAFIDIWKLAKVQSYQLTSLYVRNWGLSFLKKGQNQMTVVRNRFFKLNPGRYI